MSALGYFRRELATGVGVVAVNGREVADIVQPRKVPSNPREMLQRVLTCMEQCGSSKTPEQLVHLVRDEVESWVLPGDFT